MRDKQPIRIKSQRLNLSKENISEKRSHFNCDREKIITSTISRLRVYNATNFLPSGLIQDKFTYLLGELGQMRYLIDIFHFLFFLLLSSAEYFVSRIFAIKFSSIDFLLNFTVFYYDINLFLSNYPISLS